jgi:hypothetical protein
VRADGDDSICLWESVRSKRVYWLSADSVRDAQGRGKVWSLR